MPSRQPAVSFSQSNSCLFDRDPLSRLAAYQHRPQHPAFRANPFPKVTDLFCRLPLPTLFYRLEATHLGDLMRLWVRSIVEAVASQPEFSRSDGSAQDSTKLMLLFQLFNLISEWIHSKVKWLLQRKDNSLLDSHQLPQAELVLPRQTLPYVQQY